MRAVFRLVGLTCVVVGLAIVTANQLRAQGPDDAEYIGSRECTSCHRDVGRTFEETPHGMALVDVTSDKEFILADFSTGEGVRMIPDGDEARAFTADDIAYVMGREAQIYVMEIDRGEYKILPAEWDGKEWHALNLAATWDDAAYDWGTECASCHTTGFVEGRARWEEEGVQCEACHGPGSVHADEADDAGGSINESEMEAIRAAINVNPDAEVCGQCHSREENGNGDEWWITGHARLPNMQYNEWAESGHAHALDNLKNSDYATDECLICHSADYRIVQEMIERRETEGEDAPAPEPLTLETAKSSVTCGACHNTHDLENPVETDCLSCHQQTVVTGEIHHPVREMVAGLPVIDGIDPKTSTHYTDENGPDCITCHMPDVPIEGNGTRVSHTWEIVEPGVDGIQGDSCTSCHEDVSADYLAEFIDKTEARYRSRIDTARSAVSNRVEVETWVIAALDFVETDGSYGVHNPAYADAVLDAVELELGLVQTNFTDGIYTPAAVDPAECVECHTDEHRQWQASPHANASLQDAFLLAYGEQGNPTYCMSCHGSGYSPDTNTYQYEGVVCTSCHTLPTEANHPPGPVEVADDPETCGRCHSGAHAPTYNEWLISDHREAGVDCVDCHTPHNNGLIMGDINTTCSDCHLDTMIDEVHMADDMTCADCHMLRGENLTGHTMQIEPQVCADCHGELHSTGNGDVDEAAFVADEPVALHDNEQSEDSSDDNNNIGAIALAAAMGIVALAIGLRKVM